jgi:hypothetical protein
LGRYSDLALALLGVAGVTVLYAAVVRVEGTPAASSLLGHGLGVIGVVMMLMTETLYSLRKRAMRRPRGSMRAWLRFHIFTGIVGPYLVLLHSAWSFNGLAGALTAMTGIVVLSGFVGRYIYTAVPRTAEGAVIEAAELQALLDTARREAGVAGAAGAAGGGQAADAARRRLQTLERQMGAMRWARRTMATWHAVHIPLGAALFAMAIAHAGAALYYATLLR